MKNLMRTILLLLAFVTISGNAWGENTNFSQTYEYGLSNWSLTNYSGEKDKDNKDYYLVPWSSTGATESIATILGIFQGNTITSDIVITIKLGLYGSRTVDNPDSVFTFYNSSSLKTRIAAGRNQSYFGTTNSETTITYTITKDSVGLFTDNLYIRIQKTHTGSQNGLVRLYSISVSFTYTTGETSTETLTIPINAACTDGNKYYSTYSSSKAFVVPEGLNVSEIGINSDGTLNVQPYSTGDVVAANTGVMVSAAEGGDYTVNVTTNQATTLDGITNCLHPSGDAGITAEGMSTAAPNCLYYRLTMHNGTQIGYWWGAENGASFDLAANKAYLAVPKDANTTGPSKSNLWSDEDTSGIKEASPLPSPEEGGSIYTLAGQRVHTPVRGQLYILNGKKYIAR